MKTNKASKSHLIGDSRSEPQFAIIAPLDEEFSAVRRSVYSYSPSLPKCNPFKKIKCFIKTSAGIVAGDLIQPMASGRVEAAIATSYILSKQEYRYVILVGIAGGFHSRQNLFNDRQVALGDVVFASAIIDSEFQKITELGPEYRDRIFEQPDGVVREWLDFIRLHKWRYLPRLSHSGMMHDFHMHIGAIISGSKVVAARVNKYKDLNLAAERIASSKSYGYPLAIEMEGIGVAIANQRLNPSGSFAMLRGISDLADENKSVDESIWRKPACQNAAEVAVSFLAHVAETNKWPIVSSNQI